MIDIAKETLIPLGEVPNVLPRRAGKKLHLSTVYRWIQRGVDGVKLETLRAGRRRFTSSEALQRYFDRLTSENRNDPTQPAHSREAQIQKAERELEEAGI